MTSFASAFVIAGTLLSILAFFLLLHLNRRGKNPPGETTGHVSDGIEEYDNPLPVWWYWWFLLTILFALGYLIYYPGLGNFTGLGNWGQISQLQGEQQQANETFGPIYAEYRGMSLAEIARHPEAMRMGRRMFASNCSVCHGAKAQGSFGFPNLTDQEWLWGNSDEDLMTTISKGRVAAMLPWDEALGYEAVDQVTEYVVHLSGREADSLQVAKGRQHFNTYCIACHGSHGKGNKILGAPDLTNDIWLYGGSRVQIAQVVRRGRHGVMPAFGDRLSEDKVRILAAWVMQLEVKQLEPKQLELGP